MEGDTQSNFISNPYFILAVHTTSFVVLDNILRRSPFKKWLQTRVYKANPSRTKEQIEGTTEQALVRILGTIHNIIMIPWGFYGLFVPVLYEDKIIGKSTMSSWFTGVSAGFFCYDIFKTLANIATEGPLYAFHAIAAATVFGFGLLNGMLHWFGCAFILWEISTPFVHLRWFLYKLGLDKGPLYSLNGIMMILSFFLCRIVWGLYCLYIFVKSTNGRDEMSDPVRITAQLLCVGLTSLNLYWFHKMISKACQIIFGGKTFAEVTSEKDE